MRGVGSYCLTTANTSPLTSHEARASCCMAAKLLTPVASHALLLLAHRLNSRSACACHASAASCVIPSASRSTRLLSWSPMPTTFVRLVRMAEVAMGAAM